MIRGFAVSTLVHASVLAMAMMSWPQSSSECDRAIDKLRREYPGIRASAILIQLPQCATSCDLPIDFEDVGLVSDLADLRKAPEPKPAEETAPPPEPEDPEAAPPEEAQPEEPEEAVPVPDPQAKQEESKKPEAKKEPEKKKDPEPLIKKDPPPKKKDDLDFLNDFDKVLQDKRDTRSRTQTAEANDRPALENSDRNRAGSGERTANTASLQAYVRRELSSFWVPYDDLPPEDQIEVVIKLTLNRDGTLVGSPELVEPARRPVGRKGIVTDRALGAARKFFAERRLRLPEESYSQWQEIEVVFGRDMMSN